MGRVTQKRNLFVQERPLTASELREVKSCSEEARAILRIGKTKRATLDAPARVQAFLDTFADAKGKRSHSIEDLSLYFGCLWGDALCLKCKWTWSFVERYGAGGYAVVAPDKSRYVYPMVDMEWQLKAARRRRNTNSLLMFNLLAEGRDEVLTASGVKRHPAGELAPVGRFPGGERAG